MAKIVRKTAQVFGSTAGFQQLAQFGSLAAASPAYSTDPAVIQALSGWVEGWFGAILGGNSPAIEDMNSYCYVMAYQVAYLLQTAGGEWDSGTTYYKGSVVNDGTGKLYFSLVDTNLNNAVTSASFWLPVNGPLHPTLQIFTSGSGTYTPSYSFKTLPANATVGATYTNNSQTFTISQTISGGSQLVTTGTGAAAPTGTLTKASGTGDATITFVSVSQPLYLEVMAVGGGGGGSGSGISGGGAGGNGGNTTFGTSLLVAGGGTGSPGSTSLLGGAGGTASLGSGPIGLALSGSYGDSGATDSGAAVNGSGGSGGTSPLGGAGGGGGLLGSGAAAIPNTGSGGGGGGEGTGYCGGGGGAGGYILASIFSLLSSYSYVVGALGSAGSAGSSGFAGGAGATGIIVVKEYYQ
jgi:hypothetical protein